MPYGYAGFTAGVAKPAAVVVALDPLWAIAFAAAFVASMLLTMRRASYGIASLLFVQPFDFPHYLFDTTITLPKVVLLGTLLALAARSGWVEALCARPVRPVAVALLLFAAVVALTIGVADYRGVAIRETLKWVEYLALFCAVCVAYRRDPNDFLLVHVWSGVTFLVALLALLEYAFGAGSAIAIGGHVVPRIAGPLEGPNQLAGYLETSIAVFCAWCGRSRELPIALVVALCVLALTFSRGGAIGACVVIATVLTLRPASRKSLLAPLVTGIPLAAASVCAWLVAAKIPGALPVAPSWLYAGGVGYRGELWHAAIVLWKRHPWLGVGAGNYEFELARAGVAGVQTHANSWYLQSLAEGGIVLLLATLALVGTTIATLATRARQAHPWQLAALAAAIALAIHQIADDLVFYPKVAGVWWIAIALGVSAMVSRSATNPEPGISTS
jgi:O-antigen ligase